jgi:septum formation protein
MNNRPDRGRDEALPEIVLASTSLYRRALLERLGLGFRCVVPPCDENLYKGRRLGPRGLVENLALAKAASVRPDEPDAMIIGCDQVAAFQGQIFGKPGTANKAIEQLSALAGQTHELYTALVVLHEDRVVSHTDVTRLRMRDLSRSAIERYVATDQPFDCAGSYKLESRGIVLFDRIETADHSAITGLPLISLVSMLRDLGFEIP